MTTGIHHITCVSSNAQETVDFYRDVLGLRLVKKSVNQDDVSTYHLFFGDKLGNPGMDLTFFPFQPVSLGTQGNGQVTKISLVVPIGSKKFWIERLKKLKIVHDDLSERFGLERLVFYDIDHLRLELVFIEDKDIDFNHEYVWETNEVKKENAIRSFHSATLASPDKILIEPILTDVFKYELIDSVNKISLYKVRDSKRAQFIEVEEDTSFQIGVAGTGTVHHIAFRAKDEREQLILQEKVMQLGLYPTEVIDRFYFKSVYFRTPARILFEIATDEPGFTVDQNENELGDKLALPPFLESKRAEIEDGLTPIY